MDSMAHSKVEEVCKTQSATHRRLLGRYVGLCDNIIRVKDADAEKLFGGKREKWWEMRKELDDDGRRLESTICRPHRRLLGRYVGRCDNIIGAKDADAVKLPGEKREKR